MKLYHYHPETKRITGVSEARPDPLEHELLKAEKKDPNVAPEKWLIPAHATVEVPPPAKAGYVIVFGAIGWEYEAVKVEIR